MLGERIKKAREEAGMTIAQLAAALELDPRTVAGYQAERSKPSYDRLVRIAETLGKPPSYFIDEERAA